METNLELLRSILGWCAILNFGILLLWAAVMFLVPAVIFNTHGRWLGLSRERICSIHYSGMLFFKLSIFMFFVIPYLVLRLLV